MKKNVKKVEIDKEKSGFDRKGNNSNKFYAFTDFNENEDSNWLIYLSIKSFFEIKS